MAAPDNPCCGNSVTFLATAGGNLGSITEVPKPGRRNAIDDKASPLVFVMVATLSVWLSTISLWILLKMMLLVGGVTYLGGLNQIGTGTKTGTGSA
jgi:hypothetical protein